MLPLRGISCACTLSVALVTAASVCARTHGAQGGREAIEANERRALSEWDGRIAQMIRRGELKLREDQPSEDGTHHDEWYQQLHKGVRVEGGDVWRQTAGGKTTALEGTIFTGITVNPVPKLTRDEALAALQALTPDGAGPSLPPELIVLPRPDGSYVLVYRARIFTAAGATIYAIDASTGAEVSKEVESGAPKD
jgi:Fungalysin/Thermolysin Propeptide Motif